MIDPAPWQADRPLTLEDARAVIAHRFPAVDAASLRPLGSGWEFDAFVTGDGWVFRFPRRAEAATLFEPERRVHALVAGSLPPHIAVPRIELLGEAGPGFPYPIAGHRFIAGVAADLVGPDPMPALGRDIATALGAIHSIPEHAARAAGIVGAWEEAGGSEWFERGRQVVSALRDTDPAVDRATDWVHGLPSPFHEYHGPLRLIHQDLSPEHLIVDPDSGRLTGILDWTDAALGDPARDFVFLVTWQGWDFARRVLRSYTGPVDDGFEDRLRFMARLLSTMWLAWEHDRGGDTSEHVRGVRNAFAEGRAPD